VDIITYEFENIPIESIEYLSQSKHVTPKSSVLEKCKHRIKEKKFINSLGIETAPYEEVKSLEELKQAIKIIGIPAILKTCE